MITPLFNNIHIEPIEKKQVLVSDAPSLTELGLVVGVGKDVKEVKVGNTIGFVLWGVNHIEVDGKKIYIVPEDKDFILFRKDNLNRLKRNKFWYLMSFIVRKNNE